MLLVYQYTVAVFLSVGVFCYLCLRKSHTLSLSLSALMSVLCLPASFVPTFPWVQFLEDESPDELALLQNKEEQILLVSLTEPYTKLSFEVLQGARQDKNQSTTVRQDGKQMATNAPYVCFVSFNFKKRSIQLADGNKESIVPYLGVNDCDFFKAG